MEVNTQRRAAGLREKIPDISKTLDTVRFLKSRDENAEELESFFELNDTLFAKAKVPKTQEVYLWLGANVMLAYPMDEAEELLEGKLQAAKSGLENAEEDMDFLREQITVSGLPLVPPDEERVHWNKQGLTEFCYRRSRSLLLVSTTGTSACAGRKRPKARLLNPAIEKVNLERQKRHIGAISLLRPIVPIRQRERGKAVHECLRSLKHVRECRSFRGIAPALHLPSP